MLLSPSQSPYLLYQPPPSSVRSNGWSWNDKISTTVMLIIIILAIIFFTSGLLHLLVRFILRPSSRHPDGFDNVTAHQGQLQQLFHLHDAGVDQSFIETLPVFNYKSIIGLKNPFDCSVCLCEFEAEDKLRLLPKCSHAFHVDCIDTWLLAHSTCPLCRANLLSDISFINSSSPIVFVLESGSESSREIVPEREGGFGSTNSVARANSHLGIHFDNDFGSVRTDLSCKLLEVEAKYDEDQQTEVGSNEKIVTLKLGKYRTIESGSEGSSDKGVDSRRCFSMGSFAYIMDETTSLQVPIRTPMKKQPSKKPSLPLTPGHQPALSECGANSRRDFNSFEAFRSIEISGDGGGGSNGGNGTDEIRRNKKESFSASKVWLRRKKDKLYHTIGESSRWTFSLRFPVQENAGAVDDLKPKTTGSGTRRTISAMEIGRWENEGNEFACEEEIQSCNNLDSQANPPSFTRRTLQWLMGRQNNVVQSSFPENV